MKYMTKFTLVMARCPLDDLRIWEFEVEQASDFEKIYQRIIETIGDYYTRNKAGLKIK